MLGTIERIVNLFIYIASEEAVEYGRMYEGAFTRKSPLNFQNLILIHLNNHGLSLYMEIRNFFKKISEISVSKQAFSQSRDKLDPNVFKKLKDYHLKDFYVSDEVKTIKNHLIISGDGSKCTLPYKKSLIGFFGGIKNKFLKITSIAVNSTVLYDCLNKFIIDLEIDEYETSEKELMNHNMENLWDLDYLKDIPRILVYDRGFPSIEFFIKLIEKNEKFLFRVKKISYKKEKSEMKTNDEFIDINITKSRVNNIKNPEIKEKLLKIGKVNLRVTKILLPSGEEEHLISNLNKETFNYNDLKELYNLRWGIEVSFDVLKNSFYIENISGYKEIAVYQDFLSQMLAYNIVTDMENSAQKLLDEKESESESENKIDKKVNKNIAIGIVKEELVEIAILPDEGQQREKLKIFIEEMSRQYTQTSTVKSPRKTKRVYSTKNRSNNRRSF
jgi:hypothetical protein